MEAGEFAPVPAFAPQSSLGDAESRQNSQTVARKRKIRSKRDAFSTASKPSNRPNQRREATDTIPRRQTKKRADNKSLRRK
jgi:hypothetical protein